MNVWHIFQSSRFKSLLLSIGSGLSLLFFSLFCLVSYAQADGPVVDLSLNEQDTIVLGDTPHGWLGEVTGAADFNGDGIDDLLVGASGNSLDGLQYRGAAYMILGSKTLTSSINLTITRPNLSIYGANAGDALGHSVAAGDVNGDGYADMIVGADLYDSYRGAVYVILGHDGGLFSTPITMDLHTTSPALTILGQFPTGCLGRSVASADVNDDGFDDIIIGSYTADPGGRGTAGAVYVVLGNSSITSTAPSTLTLSSQSPALTIYGAASTDRLGRSVAVGDVNGDNVADIIAGAYQAIGGTKIGKTYIFYGSRTYTATSPITIDLGTGDTANVTLTGIEPDDQSGFYVGSGDLNNDNYDDVLISAYQSRGWHNGNRAQTGEVYVIYGASDLSDTIPLSTSADIVVYGVDSGGDASDFYGSRLGRSLAAGDVNGDGYDDMILGASWADPNGRTNAGQTYIIYGGPALSSTIFLSDTTASNIRILGDNYVTPVCADEWHDDCSDEAGRAVSTGDINGDGTYDIIVGAIFANNGVISDTGATYLVYGSPALTISLAPATKTITAGQTITYTLIASNTFGAWDVTSVGVFTISPAAKGNWVNNSYTGAISGTWTVTGTFGGLTTTARLTVERATAVAMGVTPDPATIRAGERVTYTAIISDAFGNGWDVTNAAVFTITGGATGSWVNNNVYASQTAGSWTVTGTYQSLRDTASLTVEPLQLAFSRTAYEVPENIGRAVITVTLSPTPLTQVSVNYGTANGSAIAGSDYLTASGVLTFNPGTTVLTFTVLITDDLVSDGNENLSLTLSNPSGAAAVLTGTASLTITDNDTAGVTVSKSSVSVTEDGANDSYNLRLNTIPTGTVTISFTTGSQLAAMTSLTFTADTTALNAQTVTVTAVNDTLVEGTHSGSIGHGASGGGYDGVSIIGVTAVITDNDINYALAANNDTVAEGNTGTTVISFTITRSGDITRSSSVTFALSGTATYGVDYTSVSPSGVLSFSGGQLSRAISMTVLGDYEVESNESITVTLSNAGGTGNGGTGSVSGSPAGTSILDDDSAGVVVTPTVLSVSEPSGTAVFTITLTSQPTATVTIPLTTSNMRCSVTGTVVISSSQWQSGVTVTVRAVDNQISDGTQACLVQTGAAVSADGHYNGLNLAKVITVTVYDNDIPGVQIIESGGSTNVTEGGITDSYGIVLKTIPLGVVTITVFTDTQVNVSESSITFTSSTWNVTRTVTVTAVDDAIYEGNHTGLITHTVSNTSTYNGISVAGVTAHITDNDDTTAPIFLTLPVLITPTGNISLAIKRPAFDWENAVDNESGVAGYTLLITSSNASISFQEASTTITTTQSSFTPTVDLKNGVYTWTVRAYDVAGNVSDYVAPESFIIASTGSNVYLPVIMR